MKAECRVVDPDSYVSKREVCRILSCSSVSLWRWLKRGDLPRPLRFSPGNPRSQLRWSRREILAWAAEQQRRTAEVQDSSEQRGIHGNAIGATRNAETPPRVASQRRLK
jgi:predicted DNA-binding transcriptional regulator AlpA